MIFFDQTFFSDCFIAKDILPLFESAPEKRSSEEESFGARLRFLLDLRFEVSKLKVCTLKKNYKKNKYAERTFRIDKISLILISIN